MNLPFNGMNGFFWWQGVVENVDDENLLGRVQVRLFGIHSSEKIPNDATGQGIPTKDLPWAQASSSITNAASSGVGESPVGLVEGSHVWGFSRDGEDYSDLVVVGSFSGIPTKKSAKFGFEDPNGVYPTIINESDLNRLSRGIIKDTWVEKQRKSISTNPLFSEPNSSYSAKYPFDHVIHTRSGHTFERDDTPDHERISKVHKSGTYEEFRPDGSKVEKIVKDNYKIVVGDDYVHIEGKVKVYINGPVEQIINGKVKQTITGDVDENITGSKKTVCTGTMNMKASLLNIDAPIKTTSTINSDAGITSGAIVSGTDVMAGNISVTKHKHIGNAGKPTSPSII